MQFFASILVIAGVAAALPGDPGYNPHPGYGKPTSKCETTSTCKAIYKTHVTTLPYKTTKTITKTEYKPWTKTTHIPSEYTVTSWVPTYWNVTKTIPVTTQTTKPACHTTTECKVHTMTSYKVEPWVWYTHSICPESSSYPTHEVKPTYSESCIVTEKPYPKTTTTCFETYSTSVCTETESECKTSTTCKKQKGYPTHPPEPTYA